MLIAHRGFSGRYPENTLRAFREAMKLPVDGIELDIRRTRDGVLVVIHDETVDRTTFGSGRVSELTWDELRQLDAGAWKGEEFAGERIPRLDEVLELVNGQTVLHLEIKEPGTEKQIAETLRRYDAIGWVKLASFHPVALKATRQVAPDASLVLIGGPRIGADDDTFRQFVRDALSNGANALSVHHSVITKERVCYCHQRYLFIGAWTVNDAELARQLVAMGVDAIASDFPDLVASVLSP
jgi:glycerophosphoryl diester phosphodiesterase